MPIISLVSLSPEKTSKYLNYASQALKDLGYETMIVDSSSKKLVAVPPLDIPYVSAYYEVLNQLTLYVGKWKKAYDDGYVILLNGALICNIYKEIFNHQEELEDLLAFQKDLYSRLTMPKFDFNIHLDLKKSERSAKRFSNFDYESYSQFVTENAEALGVTQILGANVEKTTNAILEAVLPTMTYTRSDTFSFAKADTNKLPKHLSVSKPKPDEA